MMENIKGVIISLIIISFFIQIGSVFLSNEKHRKLYSLIGATIIVSIILKFPDMRFQKSLDVENITSEILEFDPDKIKEIFNRDISEKIQQDIHNKFNVDTKVRAETDFQQVTFYITVYNNEKLIEEISGFVRDSYCSDDDEVYIDNEAY